MERIRGKIVYWNPQGRGFGIIETVHPDHSIPRSFLHVSKILRVFPEEGISVGCRVFFELDPSFNPNRPVRPNDLPHALRVDVLWPAAPQAPKEGL